jgi:predicted RNA-binding protein YlxR (DUF448 family)
MSVTKKLPTRMCLGCEKVHLKKEMIRIVKSPEGEFSVDLTGKKSGRGAYICPREACLQAAINNHRLEKSFKCAIAPGIYETLREQVVSAGIKK